MISADHEPPWYRCVCTEKATRMFSARYAACGTLAALIVQAAALAQVTGADVIGRVTDDLGGTIGTISVVFGRSVMRRPPPHSDGPRPTAQIAPTHG
jgi:hypothetical protein